LATGQCLNRSIARFNAEALRFPCALCIKFLLLYPYVLSLGFYILHFAEEYFTDFYIAFPHLFGNSWTERSFVIFNLVWFAVFTVSAVGVWHARSVAYLIVIFFALAGGIANGATHILVSLWQGRYFPGTVTAPLMLASGLILFQRLQMPVVLLVARSVAFSARSRNGSVVDSPELHARGLDHPLCSRLGSRDAGRNALFLVPRAVPATRARHTEYFLRQAYRVLDRPGTAATSPREHLPLQPQSDVCGRRYQCHRRSPSFRVVEPSHLCLRPVRLVSPASGFH
jgi:hypothetical protein